MRQNKLPTLQNATKPRRQDEALLLVE